MAELLATGGGLLDDLGVNPKVVAVQVVIFVSAFILLRHVLFERVLGFMKRREREQEELAGRARSNDREVERLRGEFEAKIAQAEKEAYDRLQEILKDALAAKAKVVGDAQKRARGELEAARQNIAREKEGALHQLRAEVAGLSREAAVRILEEPVDEATVRQVLS